MPFTQNPWCITSKIPHHVEKVVWIAKFTLNTFQPLSVFNAQTENRVFTLKESMWQEEKLELIRAMEK